MDTEQDLSFGQLKELNERFEQQLYDFNNSKNTKKAKTWKSRFLTLLLLIAGLILPFIILVRTSVYVYLRYQMNGWVALAIGCFATVLLLMAYGGFFVYRFGIGKKAFQLFTKGISVLVIAYTFYGVMYYSGLNTKTDEVRSYYRSVHPVMRVAFTTIPLVTSDMVVTDIQRTPEDYDQMGLP